MPDLSPIVPPTSFRGMMPILPTAIDEKDNIDEASTRRLVQYCLKCGAVAIGHLGGASEFQKVSDPDRRLLIEITVDETAGRVPVFIGATAPSTRAAVQYATLAESLGADMLMVGIPYAGRPTQAEVYEYYQAVSESVSIPIIVQDIPESDALLTIDFVWRMHEELANIRYIKAEGEDYIAKLAGLLERAKGKMGVIGGAGGRDLIHLLRIGVTSFVTGTEALDVHAAVVHAFLGGDEETAAQIYYNRLLPYLMFYMDHDRELLKWILYHRGIIDCPKVIPPVGRALMSPAKWREFEWVLERVGMNNRWPDIP